MEVCRLCLDLVATQGDAKPLDGETRDMVQVVAPELNLEASKNPSVCSECQKTLSRLFDFKSRVFEHEGEIREKVGDRRGTVSLKAAVTGEADPPLDPDRDKAKDRLCRTCLAPIECESFTVLRPSEPDAYLSSMLDMCLVEVDLALTKDPVMCEGCLDNLQKLHHFKSSCQDVEDKIVDYCNKNKLKESTVVDLHAVLESERPRDIEMLTVKDEDGASGSKIKDEEKEVEPKSEDEDEEMSEDEEEDEEMSEDEEVKQEELDIKSETEPGTSDSDNYKGFPNEPTNEEDTKQHTDAESPSKLFEFPCAKCNFQYPLRIELEDHESKVHNTHKCNQCSLKLYSRFKYVIHRERQHKSNVLGSYKCSICNYTSNVWDDLSNHMVTEHTKRVKLQCDLCPATFTSEDNFLFHKAEWFHNEIYPCEKCSYVTNEKVLLDKHKREGHMSEKYLISTNQFKVNVLLDKHNREEHISEKHVINTNQFKIIAKRKKEMHHCPKCRYTTDEEETLSTHKEVKHSIYECGLCPAEFNSRQEVILHQATKHGVRYIMPKRPSN